MEISQNVLKLLHDINGAPLELLSDEYAVVVR